MHIPDQLLSIVVSQELQVIIQWETGLRDQCRFGSRVKEGVMVQGERIRSSEIQESRRRRREVREGQEKERQ